MKEAAAVESGSAAAATAVDLDEPSGDESGHGATSSGSTINAPSRSSTVTLYSCDACAHFVTSSYHDLERHALQHHADALVDYTRLRTVAEKLVPVWAEVVRRKHTAIQKLGQEVFRVAVQRDAGAAKMAEAHRARAQLELVVKRWHPGARVFIFGSSVAFGVWDGMSDIDFTVVDVDELEAGTWPPSEKNAVRTITELLRRAGFSFINLEPIAHARVPIIKHHASLPIRLTDEQRQRLCDEAHRAVAAATTSGSAAACQGRDAALPVGESESGVGQLEAELVIARSVRYNLNLPASPLDSAVLEASIRLAVGNAAVQQLWWNRTRDMCCVTLDTTTNAVKAATCPLHFVTAGMRARVQPLHEECRPELHGMDFDLSFRAFGIRNSHLLRRYLLSHPCARPGALVLKDWSKSSGVNNSVNGYLTSYAINIMWIYYLVHHNIIPYVSPTGDIPASLRGNVSGDPEYTAMVDPAWTAEERAAMEAQAGELLLGFFYYYAFDFDWEKDVVSLNQPGVTTKASLGWDVEESAFVGGQQQLQGSTASLNGGAMDGGAAAAAAAGGSTGTLFALSQSFPQQDGGSNSSSSSVGDAGAAARRNRSTTRYSFCIEDPYEENLNLGRHMGVTKTLRVQTELYRGLLSLLKDDVAHSAVFGSSSTSTTTREKVTQSDGAAGAKGVVEPTELPLRVLFRLMAIATREMAVARSAHQRHLSSSSPSLSPSTSGEFPGLPLAQLTAAFAAQAPAEWKVACSAWNVQQVVHRLGLKLHGGTQVLPRRTVGARRQHGASAPPPGVVPSHAPEPKIKLAQPSAQSLGVDVEASTTARIAEQNSRLLGSLSTQHLSTDMLMAITRGYACLTPAWVAWSKPWAAVSAWWTDRREEIMQQSPSTTTAAPPLSANAVGTAAANASPSQRVGAHPEQPMGAMRTTRTQLLRASSSRQVWSSAGTAAVPTQGTAGLAPPPRVVSSAALRRAWRVLLRR